MGVGRSSLAAVSAALALLVAAPMAAAAVPAQGALSQDERVSGLWYADRMKFDQIREQGLTGKGITIAVVDDAINLDAPELQGADIEVRGQFCKNRATGDSPPAVSDELARSHGTNVVSMLVGNGVAGDGELGTQGIVPEAKILFYAVGSPEESFSESGDPVCEAYNPVKKEFEADTARDNSDEAEWPINNPAALAARQAVADGASIVSVSSVESIFAAGWENTQIHAMRAGVPIVAGSTNPTASGTLEYLLPFGMNGVVAVNGVDRDGGVIQGLNIYGTDIEEAKGSSNLAFAGPASDLLMPSGKDAWEPALGSGTSYATPLVAGTIALGLEKYPSASAFQILQVMIRTTGLNELSDPVWDGPKYGFGIVNPVAMLAVDPTTYPDENPLFVVRLDDPRCGVDPVDFSDCDWAYMNPIAEEVWPPGGSEGEVTGGNTAHAMNGVVVGALIVFGIGILAAAVIVPIVLARSRKTRERTLEHVEQNVED